MNVKELKLWLNQFDDDVEVNIVYHTDGYGYYNQGGDATTVRFNPTDETPFSDGSIYCENGHFEYIDYTRYNIDEKSKDHNKKVLTIGGFRQ